MWTAVPHAWMREEAWGKHRFSTPVKLALMKEVRVFTFLNYVFISWKGLQSRSSLGQSVEKDDTVGEKHKYTNERKKQGVGRVQEIKKYRMQFYFQVQQKPPTLKLHFWSPFPICSLFWFWFSFPASASAASVLGWWGGGGGGRRGSPIQGSWTKLDTLNQPERRSGPAPAVQFEKTQIPSKKKRTMAVTLIMKSQLRQRLPLKTCQGNPLGNLFMKTCIPDYSMMLMQNIIIWENTLENSNKQNSMHSDFTFKDSNKLIGCHNIVKDVRVTIKPFFYKGNLFLFFLNYVNSLLEPK